MPLSALRSPNQPKSATQPHLCIPCTIMMRFFTHAQVDLFTQQNSIHLLRERMARINPPQSHCRPSLVFTASAQTSPSFLLYIPLPDSSSSVITQLVHLPGFAQETASSSTTLVHGSSTSIRCDAGWIECGGGGRGRCVLQRLAVVRTRQWISDSGSFHRKFLSSHTDVTAAAFYVTI